MVELNSSPAAPDVRGLSAGGEAIAYDCRGAYTLAVKTRSVATADAWGVLPPYLVGGGSQLVTVTNGRFRAARVADRPIPQM